VTPAQAEGLHCAADPEALETTALESAATLWAILDTAAGLPGTPASEAKVRQAKDVLSQRISDAGLDVEGVRTRASRPTGGGTNAGRAETASADIEADVRRRWMLSSETMVPPFAAEEAAEADCYFGCPGPHLDPGRGWSDPEPQAPKAESPRDEVSASSEVARNPRDS